MLIFDGFSVNNRFGINWHEQFLTYVKRDIFLFIE